ncbi:MAG: DNA mismatch repair protein MutS [Gemmatales bacterium]|nr:MAG: DNA mismatch repair protein MutS [Gemmatales bacterium]
MLLLFRMGDFYELFDDDAETAARILGLTLTSRDKTIPMAGFPHHSLETHLRKLLAAGLRVAVCEQVEDPAQAKGLVRREVTRVVTPGTLTEDELLDPKRSNHLAAVYFASPKGGKSVVGLAWVELSTGQFFAFDVDGRQLGDELCRLDPAECLSGDSQADALRAEVSDVLAQATFTARPDWTFEKAAALDALTRHFRVATLTGFGFDDDQPCVRAAGALLIYLQETLKSDVAHLRRVQPYRQGNHLVLDEVTRRSLELVRTIRERDREGSLLSVLDQTVTSMGARLLCDWLLTPLAHRQQIDARLDAIEELVGDHVFRRELRESLKEAYDLPRLTARVSTGRASPRDLAAIAHTLKLLPRIKAKVTGRSAGLIQELESRIELCADLRSALESALVDQPPISAREGGIIKPGYRAELDELRKIARGGKEWIARFQASEIQRTGIGSLKVGFNKVFGYYIEITHVHADKVPPDYVRKQTLKNAERYITPELKEYEEKVLGAEEKSQKLEYELFVELRQKVAAEIPRLLETGVVLATLDVLAALAELASQRNYCRPKLVEEPILDIREGRHPVLDQTLPAGSFVPNDVLLTPEHGHFWLITGPNMAGKSTFIRQVALLTILAQMGSFVPAREATVGIVDRIFTRVGASDELNRGRSTFMVEMTEAANILNNATARSLIILDEIGRGTSTYDGVSLAWAITEYLHNEVGCRCLFATHYHELAQLAESLPRLCNYNVLVQEWQDQIIFLHKIAPGSADKSYGIHVARLAGIPPSVLERAEEVLAELEAQHLSKPARINVKMRPKRPKESAHPSLFAEFDQASHPEPD